MRENFRRYLDARLAVYRALPDLEAANADHMATFAFAVAGAVYVILDLEFPRFGFIRVDAFDAVLVDVRKSMQ